MRGRILPRVVGYQVMIDGAKLLRGSDTAVAVGNQQPAPRDTTEVETVTIRTSAGDTAPLQDAYITFFGTHVDVSAGQFKIAVSYEGLQPSTQLLLPERALVSRYYGDRRDIGIKLEQRGACGGSVLALYDGQGPNQVDSNLQKDIALRVEECPVAGLLLGAVGYAALGQRSLPGTQDRAEADLRLDAGRVVVQAEYIHGWDRNMLGTRIEGHGAYAAGAVTLVQSVQVAARIGFLDPDVHSGNTSTGTTEVTHVETGINAVIRTTGVRFQLGYGLFVPALSTVRPRHEVTLSTQIAF